MPRLVARDADALMHAVTESCRIKAEIVAADEREAGERALLNFGHTFGHAIEAGVGYGEWLHGEAVAAGMVTAARLSARLGWIAEADVVRLSALLQRCATPRGRAADGASAAGSSSSVATRRSTADRCASYCCARSATRSSPPISIRWPSRRCCEICTARLSRARALHPGARPVTMSKGRPRAPFRTRQSPERLRTGCSWS